MTNDELIAHLFAQEAAHLKLVREIEQSMSHTGWWVTRKDELIIYLVAAEESLRQRVERWLTTPQPGLFESQRNVALAKAGYYRHDPQEPT